MKLTTETLQVLQNLSNINMNLIVDPEKPLGTLAPTKTLCARCSIDADFPQDFAIYDLPEFLSCFNLVGNDPEIYFEKNFVTIKGSNSEIQYFFSKPEVLNTSLNSIKLDKVDASFDLSEENLAQLKKASSAIGHKKVHFLVEDGNFVARLEDPKNTTANSFSLTLHETEVRDISFFLDVDNFKFLQGNYKAQYSSAGFVQFDHEEKPFTYWIVLEK